MKTFVFTETVVKHSKTYGYSVINCRIYRLKNNQPIVIGSCEYTTGVTRGAESEVYAELVNMGIIPKKLFQQTQQYYGKEVEDKGFKIIRLY